MVLRFKSTPAWPDGEGNPKGLRSHELRVPASRYYVPSASVSAGVFILSSALALIACELAQVCGFHFIADGEEAFLPPVLGGMLSLPAFLAALRFEIRFLMHMCASDDRQCAFEQFRFTR